MPTDAVLQSSATSGDRIVFSVENARHPHVVSAVAYWRSLCGQRRFPARSDLTLRGMASFIPFSLIVAVIDGGADYEYRFVGDAERQAFKRNFKGMRVSQVEKEVPSFGRVLRATYEEARSTGRPFGVRGLADHKPESPWLPYHESVFLPLGASDDAVDHLLITGVSVERARSSVDLKFPLGASPTT
jgi:hypothetical protein